MRLQRAAECALATMQPYGDDVFRESEPRRDLGLWPLKQVALNQYLPCWGRKQRQRAIKQLRQLRALQLKLDVIHIRHILTGRYDPIPAARRAATLDGYKLASGTLRAMPATQASHAAWSRNVSAWRHASSSDSCARSSAASASPLR